MNKFNAIRPILTAALLSFTTSLSSAAVVITVAPPPLPVYDQPPCPGDGYLWTPGYWAWDADDSDYYWVPGVWVLAPAVGVLWTPGWWGYEGGGYVWHVGFWGPSVGFYGGINYGFGYFGTGFVGGLWEGNVFRYNAAVWHVDKTTVRNVYVDKTVINNRIVTNNRVSFNGPGGANAKPTDAELAAMRQQHLDLTRDQRQHELAARQDRNQHYSVNHGQPKQVALQKPKSAEEHQTAATNGAATKRAEQKTGVTHPAEHTAAANRHRQHNTTARHQANTAHRLAHNTTATHRIIHTRQSSQAEFQARRANHARAADPATRRPTKPASKPPVNQVKRP